MLMVFLTPNSFAFNAVFRKVAGVASEKVTVELLKVKCLPVLLYGLEACPISNKQFNSLDFVLKGCFKKIFRTRSAEVVQSCMLYLIACLCRSVLPNVNVNFLQIMLNLITYYAMSVKTLRHMN